MMPPRVDASNASRRVVSFFVRFRQGKVPKCFRRREPHAGLPMSTRNRWHVGWWLTWWFNVRQGQQATFKFLSWLRARTLAPGTASNISLCTPSLTRWTGRFIQSLWRSTTRCFDDELKNILLGRRSGRISVRITWSSRTGIAQNRSSKPDEEFVARWRLCVHPCDGSAP